LPPPGFNKSLQEVLFLQALFHFALKNYVLKARSQWIGFAWSFRCVCHITSKAKISSCPHSIEKICKKPIISDLSTKSCWDMKVVGEEMGYKKLGVDNMHCAPWNREYKVVLDLIEWS